MPITTAMIKLRGGATTSDPRLDRVPQWDPRNEDFLITDVVDAAPRTKMWRAFTVLDQHLTGACVGFAWTHELLALPVREVGLDAKFAIERVYWEAQKIDPWPGGEYPGAKPKEAGTSVLAGAKTVQKMGGMQSYRWSLNVEHLVLAVGWGGPTVVGFYFHEGMFRPNKDGFITASGKRDGGHSMLVVGVDVDAEAFLLQNSWGPAWGLPMFGLPGGFAWMSFADMEKLLKADGEAVTPVNRGLIKQ